MKKPRAPLAAPHIHNRSLGRFPDAGREFMRVIMGVGTRFEEWACGNIEFEALEDVWPYLLESRFGEPVWG